MVAELYLKLSLKSTPDKAEFDFSFFHSLVKLYIMKASRSKKIEDNADRLIKALHFVVSKQVIY